MPESPVDQLTTTEPSAEQSEHKLIPEGNKAVIRGMARAKEPDEPFWLDDGKGPRFWIDIGKLDRYAGAEKAQASAKWGELVRSGVEHSDAFETEDRSQWLELTSLEDGVVIALYPQGEQVRLDLLRESYDLQTPERTTNVPASFFRDNGFDLDTNNRGHIGNELSPEVSQRLYDLQIGQGEFTVPTPEPPKPGPHFK